MIRSELLLEMRKARGLLMKLSREDQQVLFEAEPWVILAIVSRTNMPSVQGFKEIESEVAEHVPRVQEAWQRLAALSEDLP